MTGPGGVGQAEVAVKKIGSGSAYSRVQEGNQRPSTLRSLIHSVASLFADNEEGVGGDEGGHNEVQQVRTTLETVSASTAQSGRMQCALLHLMLPVEALARNILASI